MWERVDDILICVDKCFVFVLRFNWDIFFIVFEGYYDWVVEFFIYFYVIFFLGY